MAFARGGSVRNSKQALSEDGAVFEAHTGARGQVGQCGVHGVAEEGECSGRRRPVVQAAADAEAPFVDGFAEVEEFGDAGDECV